MVKSSLQHFCAKITCKKWVRRSKNSLLPLKYGTYKGKSLSDDETKAHKREK